MGSNEKQIAPPLPQGFIYDQQGETLLGLPAGFILDKPESQGLGDMEALSAPLFEGEYDAVKAAIKAPVQAARDIYNTVKSTSALDISQQLAGPGGITSSGPAFVQGAAQFVTRALLGHIAAPLIETARQAAHGAMGGKVDWNAIANSPNQALDATDQMFEAFFPAPELNDAGKAILETSGLAVIEGGSSGFKAFSDLARYHGSDTAADLMGFMGDIVYPLISGPMMGKGMKANQPPKWWSGKWPGLDTTFAAHEVFDGAIAKTQGQAGKALPPPPTGFVLRGAPEEVYSPYNPEMATALGRGKVLALPEGQGFELRGAPEEVYSPITTPLWARIFPSSETEVLGNIGLGESLPSSVLKSLFEKGTRFNDFLNRSAVDIVMARGALDRQAVIRNAHDEFNAMFPDMVDDVLTRAEKAEFTRFQKEAGEPPAQPKIIPTPEEGPIPNEGTIHGITEETAGTKTPIEPGPGPGAQTATSKVEAGTDMEQLTLALENLPDNGEGFAQKFYKNLNPFKPGVVYDATTKAYMQMASLGRTIWDTLVNAPTWSEYQGVVGEFNFKLQMAKYQANLFAKEITKKHGTDTREAIFNYVAAGGDEAKLKAWADASKSDMRPGYERALKLTEDEKHTSNNIIEYYESKLQKLMDAGLLNEGVQNYINIRWETHPEAAKQLMSDMQAGMFESNPSLLRRRVFENHFAGEQAGWRGNKDAGKAILDYDDAINRTLATRSLVKSLFSMYARDGRKMLVPSGSIRPLPKGSDIPEALLIDPKSKPIVGGPGIENAPSTDYMEIVDPAFKKWVFRRNVEGVDIFTHDTVLVHPEIYTHLNNLLKPSWIRQSKVGKTLLSASQHIKGTLLSFSGFHQTNVGYHAITHWINPFNVAEIDFTNPRVVGLIRAGAVISDVYRTNAFIEGCASAGIVESIPGIGPYLAQYSNYLFNSYIPRLKIKMALHAFENNMERYGNKLSVDQIYKITADQSNAAFGMMDKIIPRAKADGTGFTGPSKSLQDALRLFLLAPDFLEARMRFVGQSFRMYGNGPAGIINNEQFMASAVRGALGTYGVCRALNVAITGDPHWDKPFGVIVPIDGKEMEFSWRLIAGDVFFLVDDPMQFVYNRLNPLAKIGIEAMIGRNKYGQYRDTVDQIHDAFSGMLPIPMQGLTDSQKKIWQSALASLGINVFQARTTFEYALRLKKRQRDVYTVPREERKRLDLVYKYADEVRESIANGTSAGYEGEKILARIEEDTQKGRLYQKDQERIAQIATGDRVGDILKPMRIEDVLEVWPKATEAEKMQYLETVANKLQNVLEGEPERFEKLRKYKAFKDIANMLEAQGAGGNQ